MTWRSHGSMPYTVGTACGLGDRRGWIHHAPISRVGCHSPIFPISSGGGLLHTSATEVPMQRWTLSFKQRCRSFGRMSFVPSESISPLTEERARRFVWPESGSQFISSTALSALVSSHGRQILGRDCGRRRTEYAVAVTNWAPRRRTHLRLKRSPLMQDRFSVSARAGDFSRHCARNQIQAGSANIAPPASTTIVNRSFRMTLRAQSERRILCGRLTGQSRIRGARLLPFSVRGRAYRHGVANRG